MEKQVLEMLIKKLQERIDSLSVTLRNGNAADYAEYKYIVGTVRGLAYAQSEADDLLRRLEKAENDD